MQVLCFGEHLTTSVSLFFYIGYIVVHSGSVKFHCDRNHIFFVFSRVDSSFPKKPKFFTTEMQTLLFFFFFL